MNAKRIFAVIGIVLLAGIYVLSLIFAVLDHPLKHSFLSASLYGTFIIPVLIYVFIWITNLLKKDKDTDQD